MHLEFLKIFLNYALIAVFGCVSYLFINYDKLNFYQIFLLIITIYSAICAIFHITKLHKEQNNA
ncbi:MAG: hypothetical protein ACI35K_02360 [Campylobacter sp.]